MLDSVAMIPGLLSSLLTFPVTENFLLGIFLHPLQITQTFKYFKKFGVILNRENIISLMLRGCLITHFR